MMWTFAGITVGIFTLLSLAWLYTERKLKPPEPEPVEEDHPGELTVEEAIANLERIIKYLEPQGSGGRDFEIAQARLLFSLAIVRLENPGYATVDAASMIRG